MKAIHFQENDMALSDLFRDAGGDNITDVDARFDEVARQAGLIKTLGSTALLIALSKMRHNAR
jgi:hypothetical protein